MKIEKLNNVVAPMVYKDLGDVIENNKPNVVISHFDALIQDTLSINSNEIKTKILKRIGGRHLNIYKVNDYSIVELTCCKFLLVIKTTDIDSVLERLIRIPKDVKITIRYGLISGKILGLNFYANDDHIAQWMGLYYTAQSCDLLFNAKRIKSNKFQSDFNNTVIKYMNFLNVSQDIVVNMPKTPLAIENVLKLIALKLTKTCGENYGISATLLRLLSDGYGIYLSEEKFRRQLNLISNTECILNRKELIQRLNMEVIKK